MSNTLRSQEEVQKWIKNVYNDPIAKILLENSHLTETQLEILLIDVITDNLYDKQVKMEEKAKLRIKRKISKGAFNRSLKQAKTNVIRSIYTLILLQYLGLVSLTTLKKYLQLPEKVKEYLEALKKAENEEEVAFLRKELRETLLTFANHKGFSSKE
ncbi:MAG: hypothetical protein DRO52_01830 [Candidatus Hecatellales archaeon]|nr:MAG: hypothetical protein DRO52_01830 [Candidatus Hecatellales archaeon]